MKVINYLCDRCGKKICADDIVRKKVLTICQFEESKTLDLCNDCEFEFRKWLAGIISEVQDDKLYC